MKAILELTTCSTHSANGIKLEDLEVMHKFLLKAKLIQALRNVLYKKLTYTWKPAKLKFLEPENEHRFVMREQWGKGLKSINSLSASYYFNV